MQKLYIFLITIVLFLSCDSSNQDSSWKENVNVSYIMKLPSNDKKSNLYSYYVKYKNTDYGSTWFTIMPDKKKFDPFARHFMFKTSIGGFNILGWNGDTIKSICILTDSQPKDLQPFKREVKKWQNWYWDISYYFANSFGGTTYYSLDSIKLEKDIIIFSGNSQP